MEVEFFDFSKHYAEVAGWWSRHKWPIIAPKMLPRTGIMVREEATNVCVGWIYCTDSTMCWLEFIVANPDAPGKLRFKALDLLIETLSGHAKDMGFEVVFSSLQHKGLMKKFVKAGYVKTDEGVTHFVRRF